MAFGALAYDPMTGLAITPEEPDPRAPVVVTPQGPFSKAVNRLAGTQFGEPRMQTWPEKLVRSAATLPGDVVSGEQPMLPPGLRREDYTDAAPPSGLTVAAQPNDPAYERAQDLAGMAGGGMMFGRLGAEATLGSGPVMRRNSMIDNADQLRELANQRRARGEATGKSAPGWDFKRPDAPKGSWEDTVARTKARWEADKARALAGFEDVVPTKNPSPYLTPDDHAFMASGQFLSDSAVPGAPIAALEHAPKFYSGLERAVDAVPQPKMTGEQWLGTLNNRGVKPEEMDWTGLRGFLAERRDQPVTKAQVAEHLGANKLELGEAHKGDISDPLVNYLHESYGPATKHIQTSQDVADARKFNSAFRETTKGLSDEEVISAARKSEQFEGVGDTKFQSYQLPGGENYREKLLTLPQKNTAAFAVRKNDNGTFSSHDTTGKYGSSGGTFSTEAEAAADAVSRNQEKRFDQGNYRSSHWDEPNVLVHRRTNERDVNGQPSLHIEEIQSDWHQAGRKQGYRSEYKGRSIEEINKDMDANLTEQMRREPDENAGFAGWERHPDLLNRHRQLQEEYNGADNARVGHGVPDAPFKKNWHELALKDAIREAAEKGIDRISWTPGEAQAARYDLSKHVKEIEYVKNSDGTYRLGVADKEGEPVGALPGMDVNRMTAPQIEQAFGKEIAEKVTKGEGKKYRGHDGFTLEGVDLKVGGSGMKGFYDKMIPDALNKIGKPHGVKVQSGTARIHPSYWADGPLEPVHRPEQYAPVHYMDIPQSLKDQALKKGFSLFEDSAAAGAPVAAIEHAGHHSAIQQAFHDEMGPQAGQSAYEEYLAAHGGQ